MAKRVAGAKTLAQMKAMLTPAQRAAVKKRVKELAAEEMTLGDLRKAMNFTQQELAKSLGMKQASVSQMENANDMYVSTLSKHVAALGGRLRFTVEFPRRPPVSIIGLKEDAAAEPQKKRA